MKLCSRASSAWVSAGDSGRPFFSISRFTDPCRVSDHNRDLILVPLLVAIAPERVVVRIGSQLRVHCLLHDVPLHPAHACGTSTEERHNQRCTKASTSNPIS